VTRGVYYGSGGEFGLCTALADETVDAAIQGLRGAVEDLAAARQQSPSIRERV
jgi:hypothetical protein